MIAQKIRAVFDRGQIPITRVLTCGRFIHVDTFRTHDSRIQHILTAAGFRILCADSGPHLDGSTVWRISAKLNPTPAPVPTPV